MSRSDKRDVKSPLLQRAQRLVVFEAAFASSSLWLANSSRTILRLVAWARTRFRTSPVQGRPRPRKCVGATRRDHCGSNSRFLTSRNECLVQGVTGGKYGHKRTCFPLASSTSILYPFFFSHWANSVKSLSSSSTVWTLASALKYSSTLLRSTFSTVPPSTTSASDPPPTASAAGAREQPTPGTRQSTTAIRRSHRSPEAARQRSTHRRRS